MYIYLKRNNIHSKSVVLLIDRIPYKLKNVFFIPSIG